MRIIKIKKLRRLHGLRFSPQADQLLVFGGDEGGGPDTAVWIDVASGESIRSRPCFVDSYGFSTDGSRLVVGTSDPDLAGLPNPVCWCYPWDSVFQWRPVKVIPLRLE